MVVGLEVVPVVVTGPVPVPVSTGGSVEPGVVVGVSVGGLPVPVPVSVPGSVLPEVVPESVGVCSGVPVGSSVGKVIVGNVIVGRVIVGSVKIGESVVLELVSVLSDAAGVVPGSEADGPAVEVFWSTVFVEVFTSVDGAELASLVDVGPAGVGVEDGLSDVGSAGVEDGD